MFDDEENDYDTAALKAFGVGLAIDLAILSVIILLGIDGWAVFALGFVIFSHLAISLWVMVFRRGSMDEDEYNFLRYGIIAVLVFLL